MGYMEPLGFVQDLNHENNVVTLTGQVNWRLFCLSLFEPVFKMWRKRTVP